MMSDSSYVISSLVIMIPTPNLLLGCPLVYTLDYVNNKASFSTMQVNAQSLLVNFDKFDIMWGKCKINLYNWCAEHLASYKVFLEFL